MEILPYRPDEGAVLFEYWNEVGKSIPYFYPVSFDAWQDCLVNDQLGEEPLFHAVETGYVLSQGRVVGMAQYGQPYFTWDENVEKVYRPSIGILRHLYFQADQPEVGEALLAWAINGLGVHRPLHAFYHHLGMGCNAYHGKLHTSLVHVAACLQAHGFQAEHENEFFSLELPQTGLEKQENLSLVIERGAYESYVQCQEDGETIGSATLRYLGDLTGGRTKDTVYLSWFGIAAEKRSRGLGRRFVRLLAAILSGQGYRWLHLDTASHNLGARRFYRSLEFRSLGMTRSFVRQGG